MRVLDLYRNSIRRARFRCKGPLRLDLLAVDPVAQRPGVLATLRGIARMLACGRRAALVRVGTVVGPVALLEDGAAAVDRKSHDSQPALTSQGDWDEGCGPLTCNKARKR